MICDVKFKDYLICRINGEVVKEVKNVDKCFRILEFFVEKLIKGLWWGDFEFLVDFVFFRLGW